MTDNRIPLAAIGAVFFTGGTPVAVTNENLARLCSDTGATDVAATASYNTLRYHILLLPYPFDVTHVWRGSYDANWANYAFEWSADTTDGFDGTWQTLVTSPPKENPLGGGSPTLVDGGGALGLRAWRWHIKGGSAGGTQINHIATYGTRSSPRGLHLIETGTTDPVVGADLGGDLKFGVVREKTFRVRNDEATGANGVTLSVGNNLNDAWVGDTITVEFSDGGAFSSSLNIGDLDAGTQSGTITMRVSIPSGQPIQTYRPHIVVDATSWD